MEETSTTAPRAVALERHGLRTFEDSLPALSKTSFGRGDLRCFGEYCLAEIW
jgi:hypothetical protein